MKISKLILPFVAVFILVFAFEYVVHGVLLSSTYQQLGHVWRPHEEMSNYFIYMTISQIGFALCLTVFYAFIQEKTKFALEGWHFGFGVGAILAVLNIGMYAYLPITLYLVADWFIASLVESVLCGVLLACTYKK